MMCYNSCIEEQKKAEFVLRATKSVTSRSKALGTQKIQIKTKLFDAHTLSIFMDINRLKLNSTSIQIAYIFFELE